MDWTTLVNEIADVCAKETLEMEDIKLVINHLQTVYDAMEEIRTTLNLQKQVKRIQKNAKDKTVAEFLSSNKNARRNIQTIEQYESVIQTIDSFLEKKDNNVIKTQMIQAKKIITLLRNLVKTNIQYKLFIIGKDSNNQDVILMGHTSLDDFVKSSGFLNSNLDLTFALTTQEAQSIIDSYNQEDSILGQWSNILTKEREQAWNVLTQVKQAVKSKMYINYGELLESLIYLDNKVLTVENIYNSLIQGLNLTSFEQGGDFVLEGEEVQSKVVSAFGPTNLLHRIRYISISNICRVIYSLKIAFENCQDPNQIKNELETVFNQQTSSIINKMNNVEENVIKKKIEEIMQNLKIV